MRVACVEDSNSVQVACAGEMRSCSSVSPIRVACMGDSNTVGSRMDRLLSFPAVLGSILGEENYMVQNFGRGQATGAKCGEHAYIETPRCSKALEFQPDICVCMLGTNDARGADADQFEAGLHQLSEKFKPAEMLLVAPPGMKSKRRQTP